MAAIELDFTANVLASNFSSSNLTKGKLNKVTNAKTNTGREAVTVEIIVIAPMFVASTCSITATGAKINSESNNSVQANLLFNDWNSSIGVLGLQKANNTNAIPKFLKTYTLSTGSDSRAHLPVMWAKAMKKLARTRIGKALLTLNIVVIDRSFIDIT